MQKITPFLWFDDNAEEAAKFYASIFKNSKILSVTREAGPKSKVMFLTFKLDGQEFFALNGGPEFTFTPAISLYVDCQTQQEVDDLWEKLSKGGEERTLRLAGRQTWSFLANNPLCFGQMMGDKDPKKAERVRNAMLKMDKIDIKTLKQAYEQQ